MLRDAKQKCNSHQIKCCDANWRSRWRGHANWTFCDFVAARSMSKSRRIDVVSDPNRLSAASSVRSDRSEHDPTRFSESKNKTCASHRSCTSLRPRGVGSMFDARAICPFIVCVDCLHDCLHPRPVMRIGGLANRGTQNRLFGTLVPPVRCQRVVGSTSFLIQIVFSHCPASVPSGPSAIRQDLASRKIRLAYPTDLVHRCDFRVWGSMCAARAILSFYSLRRLFAPPDP